MELIGLDKHETDSVHPFAIRKILPLAAIKPIERYFTKRQSDLEITAQDYKWSYVANRNTDTLFLKDFIFFHTREISYFYNRLSSEDGHCYVFDLEFIEGAFIAGFKDIAIDNHPDFNRRFYLRGEDEDAIRELFTDELVLFLESNPYYHVESNGHSLMILKKERLLGVQEIKRMIYFGQHLNELLQPAVNLQ